MFVLKKFLFVTLCFSSLTGCTNQQDIENNDLNRICDEDIIHRIINYDYEYKTNVPGNTLTYNYLWEGYDSINRFGPNIPIEERFNTYQTFYKSTIDCYYAVYIDEAKKDDAIKWFNSYDTEHNYDYLNYHFVNEDNVIDGKLILYIQKNDVTDYNIYSCSDLSSIPYRIEHLILAGCFKSKSIQILKNISENRVINKSIELISRIELVYEKTTNRLLPYVFDTPEKNNVLYNESLFSYSGLRLEAYPKSFENINYCYCPLLGLFNSGFSLTIRADYKDNNIVLPRYVLISDNEFADLLDLSFDSTFLDDVYRNYKKSFLEAYIDQIDYFDGCYKYALFDSESVITIIKG